MTLVAGYEQYQSWADNDLDYQEALEVMNGAWMKAVERFCGIVFAGAFGMAKTWG